MGQQQETVAGSALRRMALALLVAALGEATMVVATAMPAMAKNLKDGNPGPPTLAGPFKPGSGSLVFPDKGGACALHSNGNDPTGGGC
jgi:hypothetical protein